MGWGYFLVARKNHNTDHEERHELIYWHKFDELYNEFSGIARYEMHDSDEVVLDKKQLSELLKIVCKTPDYWADYEETLLPDIRSSGGFSTVEKLCEILHSYDEIKDAGYEIVFFGG